MGEIRVIGDGPAGCAAALAALNADCPVALHSKTVKPHHRVCGEFLSPEFVVVAESLGVWDRLAAAGAAPIRRMQVRIGKQELKCVLPEGAYGLSRFSLDALLLKVAEERGARLVRSQPASEAVPTVIATGRRHVSDAPKAQRLFGFKAHFRGPSDDAVELYFFPGGYAGVSPVEQGLTNVCGIARLEVISRFGYDFDALLASLPALRERVAPLSRCWDWLMTGPVCPIGLPSSLSGRRYPAGDALAFADPFTGSGLTNALITGRLAGRAAAHGESPEDYLKQCRRTVGSVFRNAALLRRALATRWAAALAPFVRASWLFRLTRPRAL